MDPTGLGALAVALGLQALFRDFEPTWAAKAVASVFVIAALCIFWSGHRSAVSTLTRLDGHKTVSLSRRRMAFLSALLCLAALAVGATLWLL